MTPATGIDTSALPCHSAAARMLGVGKARRSGVWIGALLALLVVACTEQLTVGPEGKFWGAGPPFMWPLRGTIASPFGDSRRIGGHLGIDLAARPGDPVAAAQSGRVAFAGLMPGYGTVVVLDHANHVSTVYAHLASTSLHDGTSVAQGETIGKLGRAPARLSSQPNRQRAPTHVPPPDHSERGALRRWLRGALLDNLAL